MLLHLLIILITSANSSNEKSEPCRSSTGLNGIQLKFAVYLVSQTIVFIPDLLKSVFFTNNS